MELNVQVDHVHVLALISWKGFISRYVGTVKGRTTIRVFNRFHKLKEKPYWGNHNHFWAKEYCGDTLGIDAEMIRKYIKCEEKRNENQKNSNTNQGIGGA